MSEPATPILHPKFRALLESLMGRELVANAYKGDWDHWRPSAEELATEVWNHEKKLTAALKAGNQARVSEHCGDLANLLMKAVEMFGE